MQAAILSIGDELILGQTLDTNAPWLASRLADIGIPPIVHLTVGDDRAAIARAVRRLIRETDILLITGGLGPTDDDLTRPALADVMGVELVRHEPSLNHIRRMFEARGREMPPRNACQAEHPRGSDILVNHWGTAPGFTAPIGRAAVYVLPGVPREMTAMFDRHIADDLLRRAADVGQTACILTAKINTFGRGESDVADLLGELMRRDRNPRVGTTVSEGLVSIRVFSAAPDRPAAAAALDDTKHLINHRLGDIIFGHDEQTLADAVAGLLRNAKLTVATAESCTGGLIGKMLTDIPGSSDYYLGGWVTYANQAKQDQLGVPPAMIERHGAVSEQVAAAMADGARLRSGASFALSVTGIAGPGGGTPDKPVGTICIALASPNRPTRVQRTLLPGDRSAIRDRSAKTALDMLRLHLLHDL